MPQPPHTTADRSAAQPLLHPVLLTRTGRQLPNNYIYMAVRLFDLDRTVFIQRITSIMLRIHTYIYIVTRFFVLKHKKYGNKAGNYKKNRQDYIAFFYDIFNFRFIAFIICQC